MRSVLRSVQADVVLAVLLTGISLAILATGHDGGTSQTEWPAYALTVLSAAPIAMRQRAPMTITMVMSVAVAAFGLVGYGQIPQGGVGLLIGLFSVALLRPWPTSLIALLVILTFNVVVGPEPLGDLSAWSNKAGGALEAAATCVIGESTKRWSQRVERLADQAARAVTDERLRIAHELHDVVAHHMSVIAVQAGLAEYVLDTNQTVARTALGTVSQTSREALAEMRHMLTVLRVDAAPCLGPQPGLSELGGLVDRLRSTGLRVEVVVAGDRRALPPGPDLCVYRVVQESLTNVLKHAGAANARLSLDYGGDALTVTVTDDGSGGVTRDAGTTTRGGPSAVSRGIVGMRERAALYGGQLIAGRRPEGGFAVELRLPFPQREDVG